MGVARRRYQFYSRAAALAQDSGFPGVVLALTDALLADPVERRHAWAQMAAHLIRSRALATIGGQSEAAADLDAARALALSINDPTFRDESLAEIAITTGQILATSDASRAARALTEGLSFQQVRANQFRTASLLLTRGRAYAHAGDRARAEADWIEGTRLLEATRLPIRDAQLRIARTADTLELFEELRPCAARSSCRRASDDGADARPGTA